MTRSRAKAIHDKVNSLLSLHTFDVSVNRSLPHGDTICMLRYEPPMEHQMGAKEDQEDGHGDALEGQEEDQEEEGRKGEGKRSQEGRPRARPSSQAGCFGWGSGLGPGLEPGRPPCARPAASVGGPA